MYKIKNGNNDWKYKWLMIISHQLMEIAHQRRE